MNDQAKRLVESYEATRNHPCNVHIRCLDGTVVIQEGRVFHCPKRVGVEVLLFDDGQQRFIRAKIVAVDANDIALEEYQ